MTLIFLAFIALPIATGVTGYQISKGIREIVEVEKECLQSYCEEPVILRDVLAETKAKVEFANLAVLVAYCESGVRDVANPNSSAYGAFQFLDSTWENRCEGDKYNYRDNIKCGIDLLALGEYHHWNESESCHYFNK